jgi:hypothetical protein
MYKLRHRDRNAKALTMTDIAGTDDVSVDELREAVEHLHGVPSGSRRRLTDLP